MMYHLKLQPSEIDNFDYYEYHYYIKDMTDVLKKQKEGQDNEQQQQPSTKLPSFKQPSFKMPSMPRR